MRGKRGMWFATADWHLDHKRIPTYCRRLAFMNDGEKKNLLDAEARHAPREEMRALRYSKETIDRMNSGIIDSCNAVAGPDDEIVIAGDIIFGDIGKLRRLRERIICRHLHLVYGNHDDDIREEWERGGLRDVFDTCRDVARFNVNGQRIFVSHYAHLVWNKSHHGVWHLYGHSHGSIEHFRESLLPNARMLDVGIDYRARLGKGYTLWSFKEIQKFMEGKTGERLDHHGVRAAQELMDDGNLD